MEGLLYRLRLKSKSTRKQIAFFSALSVSLLVMMVWFQTNTMTTNSNSRSLSEGLDPINYVATVFKSISESARNKTQEAATGLNQIALTTQEQATTTDAPPDPGNAFVLDREDLLRYGISPQATTSTSILTATRTDQTIIESESTTSQSRI